MGEVTGISWTEATWKSMARLRQDFARLQVLLHVREADYFLGNFHLATKVCGTALLFGEKS